MGLGLRIQRRFRVLGHWCVRTRCGTLVYELVVCPHMASADDSSHNSFPSV